MRCLLILNDGESLKDFGKYVLRLQFTRSEGAKAMCTMDWSQLLSGENTVAHTVVWGTDYAGLPYATICEWKELNGWW